MAGNQTVKPTLEAFILSVLEQTNGFCMDEPDERKALADILTVDLLGCFKVAAKQQRFQKPVLGRMPK